MSRTITVRGTGAVSVKPDLVVLTMEFEEEKWEYEAALKSVSLAIAHLNRALMSIGFPENSPKTLSFDVESVYESYKDKRGNYKRQFKGYKCSQSLKLEFSLDKELLGKTLKAITVNTFPPELSIMFTVKDKAAVSKELLTSAAQNARDKAEILCAASGVSLGELVNINYAWTDVMFESVTKYGASEYDDLESDAYFEPEDIKAKDSVTFIWEIA